MSTTIRQGRWTPDDRAEQIYRGVPFEVPAGTARVEVELDYDRESGVLDLGCEGPGGPDGFRGWSGGARSGYVITPAAATPGYLHGPVEPGTWQVLFGLHRVAPGGLSWRLEISTSPRAGEPPSHAGAGIGRLLTGQQGSTRRDLPAPPGFQWLVGDLHAHTVHSDGRLAVDDLARLAAARGLDFLAVTDHNTVSHHPFLPAAARAAGIICVPGQEVTTSRGHANAFGDIGRIEFRDPLGAWPAAAGDRGGLLSVNHPIAADCAWLSPASAPLAEVWHSSWRNRSHGGPLAWWLSRPAGTVPVGGSDWHRPGDQALPGEPATWLLCAERSAAGVLDALAAGRTAIAADPSGPLLLRLDGELVAVDASGLLLSGPGRGRVPIRTDRIRLPADPGPCWLEDTDGTITALTSLPRSLPKIIRNGCVLRVIRAGALPGGGAEDAAGLCAGTLGFLLALLFLQDLGRVLGDLGELGVQLANLPGAPDRGAEPVMGDRGHHQESRVSRAHLLFEPVSTLHAHSFNHPRRDARGGSTSLSGNTRHRSARPPGRPDVAYTVWHRPGRTRSDTSKSRNRHKRITAVVHRSIPDGGKYRLMGNISRPGDH